MGSGSSLATEHAVVKRHEKVLPRRAKHKRTSRSSSSPRSSNSSASKRAASSCCRSSNSSASKRAASSCCCSSNNSAPKHVRFASTVFTSPENNDVITNALCELEAKPAVASERQLETPRRVASESSLHLGSLGPRKCQAPLIVQEGSTKGLPNVYIDEKTWLGEVLDDIRKNDQGNHACGSPVRFLRRNRVELCDGERIRRLRPTSSTPDIHDTPKHLQIVDRYDRQVQQSQGVTIQESVMAGVLRNTVDFEIGDEVTLNGHGNDPWRNTGKGVVIGSAGRKGYWAVRFPSTYETVHINARSLTKIAKVAKARKVPKESIL